MVILVILNPGFSWPEGTLKNAANSYVLDTSINFSGRYCLVVVPPFFWVPRSALTASSIADAAPACVEDDDWLDVRLGNSKRDV